MLKNLSEFLHPFSPSTLLFSINNSTKKLEVRNILFRKVSLSFFRNQNFSAARLVLAYSKHSTNLAYYKTQQTKSSRFIIRKKRRKICSRQQCALFFVQCVILTAPWLTVHDASQTTVLAQGNKGKHGRERVGRRICLF